MVFDVIPPNKLFPKEPFNLAIFFELSRWTFGDFLTKNFLDL